VFLDGNKYHFIIKKKRFFVGNRLHHSFWLWNEQAVIFSLKASASLKQHMIVHLEHDLENFLSKLCGLNLRKSMNLLENSYKTYSLFFHLPLWDCLLCHDICKTKETTSTLNQHFGSVLHLIRFQNTTQFFPLINMTYSTSDTFLIT